MKKTKEHPTRVDTRKESKLITELRAKINAEVIGQDRAIRRLLRAVASYYSDLKDPKRPIGGFIFAGPTGVGKTWMAKVFARHFLGGHDKYRDYLIRIDCSTLSQEHEIARLTGSPPGYVGYGEPPILSQKSIDSFHFDVKAGKDTGSFARQLKNVESARATLDTIGFPRTREPGRSLSIEQEYNSNKPYCSVIVFDEIEKAHPHIWNALLQIMEEGELQLGRSRETTDFKNSVIVLTTNIGERNIQNMLKGGIGFIQPEKITKDGSLDQRIYETVKSRVEAIFPPPLFKRLDLVVFRPLKEHDFVKILDIFLSDLQERLNELVKTASRFPIKIGYTSKAKKFLLEKGIDVNYGARTLRATVEKYVRTPISNGISSGEIKLGDSILVDEENGELVFCRKYRPRGQNAIYRKGIIIIPPKGRDH